MMTVWRGPKNFPRRRCVCDFSGEGRGWSAGVLGPFSSASHGDLWQRSQPCMEGVRVPRCAYLCSQWKLKFRSWIFLPETFPVAYFLLSWPTCSSPAPLKVGHPLSEQHQTTDQEGLAELPVHFLENNRVCCRSLLCCSPTL